MNTLIITIPSTIIPIFLASLAAYGFAWMNFPFRNTLYLTRHCAAYHPAADDLGAGVAAVQCLRIGGDLARNLAGAYRLWDAFRDFSSLQFLCRFAG